MPGDDVQKGFIALGIFAAGAAASGLAGFIKGYAMANGQHMHSEGLENIITYGPAVTGALGVGIFESRYRISDSAKGAIFGASTYVATQLIGLGAGYLIGKTVN